MSNHFIQKTLGISIPSCFSFTIISSTSDQQTPIILANQVCGSYTTTREDELARKKGEQRPNLTDGEQKGLKSIMKRVRNREIIIIKTDKSSRFVVTNEENYVRMGSVHSKRKQHRRHNRVDADM